MIKRQVIALVGLFLVAALAMLCVVSDLSLAAPVAGLVALQVANMTILRDTLDCQGKDSWANIQIGYTTVLLKNLWPRDIHQCAWMNVFLAAPARSASRDAGYERAHWGVWLSFRWRGRLIRPGYSWRADRSSCWVPPEQHFA